MSQPDPVSDAERDLHLPVQPVIASLALIGLGLMILVEFTPLSYRLGAFGMSLTCLSAIAWLLARWKDQISRWFIVIAAVFLVFLSERWLDAPVMSVLLPIPVSLATALIHPGAAAILIVLVSLPLCIPTSPWAIEDSTRLILMIVSVWTVFGLVYSMYRRVHQTEAWLLEYLQSFRRLLEEARDRKMELEQSRSDWMHASRQLALANERLANLRLVAEEARKDKAEFVAKVSHEFRTPLNIIIGMVNLMVEAPDIYGSPFPPKAMEQLLVVYRNCQHLASMIDDVLDLSQADVRQMALKREWIDIRETVEATLDVVRPLAQDKGLMLDLIVSEPVPPINCDRGRIRQVILNLLSNATRYTETGGITVTLQQQHEYVRVGVTDTGPGIPPEEKDRIFEPFRRGANAMLRGQGGSGLGLSISKELVKLHNGRMWLETQVGSGTSFYFELPISPLGSLLPAPGFQIKEDWIWRQRASWADLSQVVSRPRVIVCDESGALHAASSHYSDRAELVCVGSLDQAERELQLCPAHTLLVNAVSPDKLMHKVDNARKLMPDTPIVGCCWPTHTELPLAPTVLGYLTKPIRKDNLIAAIESVGYPIRKVLVTDDDADTREWLALLLQSYDDSLEVVTTASGEAALEALRTQEIDLLLLDIVMADMSGWEVLASKNADESLKETPTIVLSAQDIREKPARSEFLMLSVEGGISAGKLLASSAVLSTIMLQPD